MNKMKDSGIAWVGKIPEGWGLETIKQLMIERNEKNREGQTDTILSLSAKDGITLYDGENHSGNKPREDLSGYKVVHKGDIVVNSMNILSGSVGMSEYTGCVSPVYYVYYPRRNGNQQFFYYLFQSKQFQLSLRGLGNGILIKETESGSLNTIRMRIPSQKLGAQLFPVPPVEMQARIVEALNTSVIKVDTLIANVQTQIEKLKAYKQSLITEVVTKGLDPSVPMKDSGVECTGTTPEHWDICRVRNIGIPQNGISKGGEFFGEGFPFVTYGDVYRNFSLPEDVSGLIQSTVEEQKSYSVCEGDIFFTRTSETIEEVGFSCVCEKTMSTATFAGFLIRLRPFNDVLSTQYAKYYFRSTHLRQFLVKEMNIVTRASLGQNLLKNIPVLLPPKEEQQRIAEELDKRCGQIDRLIEIKQQKIDKLNDYKKSLIYEYVTGKKEV